MKYTLNEVNSMKKQEFVSAFGSVVEYTPSIAKEVFESMPFSSLGALIGAFKTQIVKSDQIMDIIRSHPQLSGKEAQEGNLTEHSTSEQARLGLDRLPPEEFEAMRKFNMEYSMKFGFPFIACLGLLKDKEELYKIRDKRLENTRQVEINEAIRQVVEIVRLRLKNMVEDT